MGILGDSFLKVAGAGSKFVDWRFFALGFVLYALTAFGWFFALKHMKLATVSVYYSVFIILLSVAVGILYFKERLSVHEFLGIGLALVSLVLLSRFT